MIRQVIESVTQGVSNADTIHRLAAINRKWALKDAVEEENANWVLGAAAEASNAEWKGTWSDTIHGE